ncbi:MAG: cobalt-precorrin-7 (C(5))-methyltransferase [Archaeoglobaceae archaeon]
MGWIVGAGVCRGHLTERAKELIARAKVVYGSRRALEVAGVLGSGKEKVLKSFDVDELKRFVEGDAVLLSTGDPMVSGLGSMLKDVNVEIEPGISSVQVALARLRVDLSEVAVVDCHARIDESMFELLKFRHLLILADRSFDLSLFGERRVVILEDLCTRRETIRSAIAAEAELNSDYAIVFVEGGR